MNRCKYYARGKCRAFGKKIDIDCSTVKNNNPSACKNDTYSHNDRKNRKNRD